MALFQPDLTVVTPYLIAVSYTHLDVYKRQTGTYSFEAGVSSVTPNSDSGKSNLSLIHI